MNLALMEIEAWFLAEWNYWAKIYNRLICDFILQKCGLDLRIIDTEQRVHPSQDLDEIYRLVSRNYDKSKKPGSPELMVISLSNQKSKLIRDS